MSYLDARMVDTGVCCNAAHPLVVYNFQGTEKLCKPRNGEIINPIRAKVFLMAVREMTC